MQKPVHTNESLEYIQKQTYILASMLQHQSYIEGFVYTYVWAWLHCDFLFFFQRGPVRFFLSPILDAILLGVSHLNWTKSRTGLS